MLVEHPSLLKAINLGDPVRLKLTLECDWQVAFYRYYLTLVCDRQVVFSRSRCLSRIMLRQLVFLSYLLLSKSVFEICFRQLSKSVCSVCFTNLLSKSTFEIWFTIYFRDLLSKCVFAIYFEKLSKYAFATCFRNLLSKSTFSISIPGNQFGTGQATCACTISASVFCFCDMQLSQPSAVVLCLFWLHRNNEL